MNKALLATTFIVILPCAMMQASEELIVELSAQDEQSLTLNVADELQKQKEAVLSIFTGNQDHIISFAKASSKAMDYDISDDSRASSPDISALNRGLAFSESKERMNKRLFSLIRNIQEIQLKEQEIKFNEMKITAHETHN